MDSIEMETKDHTEEAPLEFTPDVDIMTVLLQHEKRADQTDGPGKKSGQDADSSDEDFSKTIKNEPSLGSGNKMLLINNYSRMLYILFRNYGKYV